MKILRLIGLLCTLFLSSWQCEKANDSRFKGRLEIKGICMNYTIRMLTEPADTALIVPEWKDEVTGKTYKNVFKLGSPCTFPADIKEGDEFYFKIDSSQVQNCAVCMAYYPTPSKSLRIIILRSL
jgi:hypothetical protein